MEPSKQEIRFKKKLQGFLSEMLKFGGVKGFKHFAMYLRGREELVISVANEPKSVFNSHAITEPLVGVPQGVDLSRSGSLTSNNLPYDKRSLLLSLRSQMSLTTKEVPKGVGLPPASPSDTETQVGDENATLFLIAGYARYSCPYVWVRSNHQRLIKLTGDSESEKDSPLRLKTTSAWKDKDIQIWDIVAELVKLNTYPSPLNPFEIDNEYFTSLPVSERVIATGAIVSCMQKIILHTSDEKKYAGKVLEEFQLITKQHFSALQQLVKSGGFQALQPPGVDSNARSSTRQRPRYNSGQYSYPQTNAYGQQQQQPYHQTQQPSYHYTGY